MSENQCTAFVMVHKGRRLGWKICRGDVKDCFPSSRNFGLGPERPPREECAVEREVFNDWVKAEQWCAGFPPHPAEGGAEPRANPVRLEGVKILSGGASVDIKALHDRVQDAERRAEAAEAALEAAQAGPATPEFVQIPVPPCAVCTEPSDLMPVVWLRQGYGLGPGVESSFRAQYECCVCGSRGPVGVGPTPEAALLNALTGAAEDARRHRTWLAAMAALKHQKESGQAPSSIPDAEPPGPTVSTEASPVTSPKKAGNTQGQETRPVAGQLRQARERAGLSVGQAASLLSVSTYLIRSHETGQPMTTLDLALYADLYAVSEAWLRGETVTVEPPPGIEKLPVDEQAKLMSLIESF